MTTSKPLARYSAMGRARERPLTAELHHDRGHDPFLFFSTKEGPWPEPFRNSGVDAASPHIRSPLSTAAPQFPMLGVWLGRMGPILSAAYFSQPKSRFTPPDPTRLAEPRGLDNS